MATNKDLEKKKVEQQPGVNGTDANQNTLKGVDDATINKMNSSFTASNNQQIAQFKANEGLERVEDVTSKKNIVSNSVMNTLNSSFKKPKAVVQADAWINNQLGIIQSGKTSYSDQVKDMMAQIQGREKFSYDVDNDPLFQQALASSMNSGKQAMQDTIGQASALTGGYGSSYATTAGNQAYNSFIEDAYDNLPQYYQMAMDAYQMEVTNCIVSLVCSRMLMTENTTEISQHTMLHMLTEISCTTKHISFTETKRQMHTIWQIFSLIFTDSRLVMRLITTMQQAIMPTRCTTESTIVGLIL